MKYIKYTHVDAVTGIPVTDAPARNGPAMPAVAGLQFVWARESLYPTEQPQLFGTCPDESDTDIPGVLGLYVQQDFETMQADEMAARAALQPNKCTPAQGLIALYVLHGIKESDVHAAITAIPDPVQRYTAQIGYTRATVWERVSATTQALSMLLGLSDTDMDALFRYAIEVQV